MVSCLFLIISLVFQTSAQQQVRDPLFTIQKSNAPADTTVAYIFAHGLGATQQQGISLFARTKQISNEQTNFNSRWIVNEPLILFNFPDAKNDHNEYHRKEVNLAQENDIERLFFAYEKTRECLPNYDLVLAGISRGSSAIINFIATRQVTNVKAVVLESPFDTLSSIVKHLLLRFHVAWFPFSERIGHKICQKHFPTINPKGIFPLNVIDKIPPTIPILLVHSKKDKVVPIKSSRNLYIKLKQTGHEHAYLAELASGAHGKLINGPDNDFYLYIVHAFYKKYNLPHETELASKGIKLLSLCQPTIEEVQQRLKRKRSADENELDLFEEYDEDEDYLIDGESITI